MQKLNEHQRVPHGMVEIEGTFEQMDDAVHAIQQYALRFNPLGYGTELKMEKTDGGYYVRGSRYASCD